MENKRVFEQRPILCMAMLFIVVASAGLAHGQQCSTTSLAGNWAFSYSGTVILPSGAVPVASVGMFRSRADGTVSGSETRSIGGDVADETITATYGVSPNCKATFHFKVFDSGILARTATVTVVYDNNGRSARGIFSGLVLADGTVLPNIITVTASRISNE